ncbi:MAG: DUF6134 family protein [Planctomycetes bacterium]|nr:DUF6134 family protein [Planctomycetota bacterium]
MFKRAFIIWIFASSFAIQAAEDERRTFTVFVDNKPSGTHQIAVKTSDDGTVAVTSQADVVVKVALFTYRFTFRGAETWKGDKLIRLSTATNDNGRKHAVMVETDKDGLTATANGKSFALKGQPWVTGFWKLPPEAQRGPAVVLLDADTGKVINAKLEKVGIEKINLLGKAVECAHYRLSGGVQADLWFDGADRLVRKESIEEGHRTVLELSRLQRE